MSTRLRDGHRTLLSFALAPSVKFFQKRVTPPGIDGGGENDTTSMHNNTWRTRQPKKLYTLTPATITAAYDPAVFTEILAMINVNQLITVTFPDNSTYAFFGWVNNFTPNEHTEGEEPTASVTVIPSNQNASFVETAPVLTPS